ncbi:uncharacterized protein LOC131597930 [Vicia villosa]|uniref:uncharacterized protein LOC131597930 n=1 Tax=Vicia villosa TaxID=3911 RepID=UPI00273C1688|nr:uncharacterized protein LOC131597930 [Vicia villosa]
MSSPLTTISSSSSSSVWWKDLISIGKLSVEDPIELNSRFGVGNGFITPFWESRWVDNHFLKELFPKLFLVSSLRRMAVASMGGWVDGVWKWGNFGVVLGDDTERLVVAEHTSLHALLLGRNVFLEGRDKVEWCDSGGVSFSVASCYDFMVGYTYPLGPPNRFDEAKDLIWKVLVPFKIKVFGWRLFINRLPTKDLLMFRGISLSIENSMCAFCGIIPESCDHSFFKCDKTRVVWREIKVWVGKPVTGLEEDCLQSFMDWNGFCFRNEGWDVDNTVWNIKSLLWKWSFF